MRAPDSIASNSTTLSLAVETVPGRIPDDVGTRWYIQEPNDYDDFGAELTLVARNPINADRQRKKGTIVGLSAMGGWNTDLTASNLRMLVEGFLFANRRTKTELVAIATGDNGFTVPAGGAAYPAGTLIAASGFRIPANNGLFVSTGGADAKVSAAGTVSGDGLPGTITRAGIEFAAGVARIDVAGPLPALVAAGVDFPALGLIPGEVVFLGGDDPANRFAAPANVGYARVLSVAVGRMVFDKTDAAYVADNGAGKTVRLFFGTVIKNEKRSAQVMRSYTLRRTLGADDLDNPVDQSECVSKAVPNEFSLNFGTEDKVTVDVSFMAGDHKTFADDSVIKGVFVEPEEDDAINTASDTPRVSMMIYPKLGNTSSPVPIFAAFEEITLNINNNVSDNKAIGVMGSYALTPGMFEVGGTVNAYFASIDAIQAVRDNEDATFLICMAKQNKGVAVDLPMIALGSSGATVSQDDPIMLELDTQAATGRKYSRDMDHTILFVFFDYLPDLANG